MTTTQAFTTDTFDTFAQRDEFLGFGYIGGRLSELDNSDPEAPARPELVAQTDAAILTFASAWNWTTEELFTWANSKAGRYFADVVFGGTGTFEERFTRAQGFGYLRKQREI